MVYSKHLLIGLVLTSSIALGQGSDRVLSLLDFDPSSRPENAGWSCFGADYVIGAPFAKPTPFRSKLLSLERSGDEVIYEVEVTNVSDRVQAIPWSIEWEKVGGTSAALLKEGRPEEMPDGYLAAYVSLVGEVQDGRLSSIASVAVEGSDLLEGSILELAPGESARFQAKGSWQLTDRFVRGEKGEVAVRARFWFRCRVPSAEAAVSANSILVSAKPRR